MECTIQKFIYGAGKYGKLLARELADLGEKIDYFVETNEPAIMEIDDVPVISFEKMIKMDGRKVIFIAIKNEKIARKIRNNIYASGSSDCVVYLCGNFINDNLLLNKVNIYLEGEKHCIMCGNNFNEFLPAGIQQDIFNRHHIIGGGIDKTVNAHIVDQ